MQPESCNIIEFEEGIPSVDTLLAFMKAFFICVGAKNIAFFPLLYA
jgi:hypothetical protein